MSGLLYPGNKYGDVGSILGIIEDHRIVDFDSEFARVQFRDGETITVDIEGNARIMNSLKRRQTNGRWIPPRFMFREFCRTRIVLLGAHPERLLDINEDSAISEGVERHESGGWVNYIDPSQTVETARESFLTLWALIHGEDSLIANPYIWAMSFDLTSKLNPYA